MKIGFIVEPYEETGASGMGYLVLELMRHLPPAGKEHEFTMYSSAPINKTLVSVPVRNVIVPASIIGKFFWFLRTKEDIDALLFVAPLMPLILPRRIKSIVLCPELGSQKITPGTIAGKMIAFIRDHVLMPACLSRAAHIIAISEATKVDIVHYYHVAKEKIKVIYVGYQDLTQFRGKAPSIDASKKPYFFFTGRVKPRKNVHGIVSAFITFKKKSGADCKLIIGGKSGGPYYEEMLSELKKNHLEQDVFFVGHVPTEMLYAYYAHALAFVFPSLNEGFGMPVVEAMNLGTPVITSNISSLPEAAGGAALLVDPYNMDDIAHAMERIYVDASLRETMRKKGIEHAKKFSWNKTAQEFLTLIERYAG